MEKTIAEAIAAIGAAATGATLWLAKTGKIGSGGCPDAECRKLQEAHEVRLAEGGVIISRLEVRLTQQDQVLREISDKLSDLAGFVRGNQTAHREG